MIDEKMIEDRIIVLDEDIQKINEQVVVLEKKKTEAISMLNALSGAKQQCSNFLAQINDDGQASGQSDVSQEDAAELVAFDS